MTIEYNQCMKHDDFKDLYFIPVDPKMPDLILTKYGYDTKKVFKVVKLNFLYKSSLAKWYTIIER